MRTIVSSTSSGCADAKHAAIAPPWYPAHPLSQDHHQFETNREQGTHHGHSDDYSFGPSDVRERGSELGRVEFWDVRWRGRRRSGGERGGASVYPRPYKSSSPTSVFFDIKRREKVRADRITESGTHRPVAGLGSSK